VDRVTKSRMRGTAPDHSRTENPVKRILRADAVAADRCAATPGRKG
jgi:hypothetical protein